MAISQKHAKRILETERDATPRELQTWVKANSARLEKDLAEAEASLDRGEGKPWDLVEFLTEAETPPQEKESQEALTLAQWANPISFYRRKREQI